MSVSGSKLPYEQGVGSLHGTDERMKARGRKGFPWRAFGNRVWLEMLKDKEKVTGAGIIIPVGQKKAERSVGRIVALGPGEFSNGAFISTLEWYDLEVYDVVLIPTNCGEDTTVDGVDYKIIFPHDILGVLRRGLGQEMRAELAKAGKEADRIHRERGVNAGETAVASQIPELPKPPDIGDRVGEAQEDFRRKKGTATKFQVVVPGGSSNGKK